MPTGLDSFLGDKKEHEYVIFISKTSGTMKFQYVTLDRGSHSLAPKVNTIVWARLKDLVDFTTCVFDGLLYVMGGRDKSTGKYSRDVHKYIPGLTRWKQCGSMTKPRARHKAAVVFGKMFVFGGAASDKELLDSVEWYEPFLDEWHRDKTEMPAARKDHACAVRDEQLFLLGGESQTQVANDNVWRMKRHYPDPAKPQVCEYMWHHLASTEPRRQLQYKLSRHSVCVCNNRLYIFGGVCLGSTNDGKTFSRTNVLSENSSDSTKPLIATCSMMDGYKFPSSEVPDFSIEPDLQQADRRADDKRGRRKTKQPEPEAPALRTHWMRGLPNMGAARCAAGTFSLGNKIYVVGGHAAEVNDPQPQECVVEYFHTKRKTWTTAFTLPPADYREVECVMMRIPETNRDFKPMKYSDCKWVMW